MQRLYWDAINIDGQKVFYTVTDAGLNFVSSPDYGVSQVLRFYPQAFEYVHDHQQTDHYRKALKRYLKGKSDHFGFTLDYFVDGTPQEEEVWQLIRAIPYGKTLTLAEIADQLQLEPQLVQQALQNCPLWLVVPLHRVVERGTDRGYRTDAAMRIYLRNLEQSPKSELRELL
ncbi:methylated-DNA--[protein]-cysteine S-methyltransferase [Fructilactobacillus carniphilus]|uniref:MGMT family protein n=1 Tax=Fructilactobacillus carniphilus TaxID=2940297 RepID=A0ABY5BVS0_9LACO|nr:MGMT family protein [Fructilactobacillus carniphilus]USS90326.1 MGMT family protein [Fructilactobacillus carniphilus]